MRRLRPLALFTALPSGRAGDYVARTRCAPRAYQSNDYDGAVAALEKEAKDVEIERLLYLPGKWSVLHAPARHRGLAEADRLAPAGRDLGGRGGWHAAREHARAYRGVTERLMVSVVQALNYAAR